MRSERERLLDIMEAIVSALNDMPKRASPLFMRMNSSKTGWSILSL